MIPVSVMVTGKGTVSHDIKGDFGVKSHSNFSHVNRPVLSWNITYSCNLKCVHCYIDAKNTRLEVDEERIELVKKEVKENRIPLVLLSGGEPTLYPRLPALVRDLRSSDVRVALSSNGTLLSQGLAEELSEAGLNYIGISLDSHREEWHDSFRGVRGSYSMTLMGIKNALEAGLRVGLRFTLNSGNIDHVPAYLHMAEELGVHRVTFYHLSASGRAKSLPPEWLYYRSSYDSFINYMIKFSIANEGKIEVETTLGPFDGIAIADRLASSREEFMEYMEFLKTTGGCGRKILSVYPNGDVYPCQFVDYYRLGNIREGLGRMIPRIPDYFIDPSPFLLKGKCSTCPLKSFCMGGDRTRAYYWGGGPTTSDPLCPLDGEALAKKWLS